MAEMPMSEVVERAHRLVAEYEEVVERRGPRPQGLDASMARLLDELRQTGLSPELVGAMVLLSTLITSGAGYQGTNIVLAYGSLRRAVESSAAACITQASPRAGDTDPVNLDYGG